MITSDIAFPRQESQQPTTTGAAWIWPRTNAIMKEDADVDPWEARSFAEENAGTWLPRSYACTFCKREFRSAQALGGHMNVHRRDRARLRQLSPSSDEVLPSLPATTTSVVPPTQCSSGTLYYLYPIPTENQSLVGASAPPGITATSSVITAPTTPFIMGSPCLLSTQLSSCSDLADSITPVSKTNCVSASTMSLFTSGSSAQMSANANTPVSTSTTRAGKRDSTLDFSLNLCTNYSSRKRLQTKAFEPYQATCITANDTPNLRHFKNEHQKCHVLSVDGLDLELRLGHSR